jgi:hypothetical protein
MQSEGPLTISRPSKSTWLVLFLGLAFCAGGFALAGEGYRAAGYGIAVMFGIMAVVALVTVMPGSTGLELDGEGFRTRTLYWRGGLLRWEEVGPFHAEAHGSKQVVAFELAPKGKAKGGLHPSDGGATLPDNYGYSAQSLANKLNEHREKALAAV